MVPYARDNVAQTVKSLGIGWRELLNSTVKRESGRGLIGARRGNACGVGASGQGVF